MKALTPTILQVLPAMRAGGVERGTLEMVHAIVARGWKALVASSGGPMEAQIKHAGGAHITLPLASKNPLTIRKNTKYLVEAIEGRNVSIIHARSRAPGWSAYKASKHTNIPFVTTFHGVYGLTPSIKKRYNQVMVKGDRVIAISDYIYKHINAHYLDDMSSVVTIPRGVDTELFDPQKVLIPRMIEIAKQWRIPEEHPPVILLPGRLTEWKGQEFFIEALAKLAHRNFVAILMGDDVGHPAYKRRLEHKIEALNLGPCVRFAAHSRYMAEAYQLADIVVIPSIAPEAFGRVPVEAQAMKKLVVAAGHGGALETIKNSETGFLFTPGDTEEFSQAIEYCLIMKEDMRNTIGEDARAHVHKNFSAAKMQQSTLALYESLL